MIYTLEFTKVEVKVRRYTSIYKVQDDYPTDIIAHDAVMKLIQNLEVGTDKFTIDRCRKGYSNHTEVRLYGKLKSVRHAIVDINTIYIDSPGKVKYESDMVAIKKTW